MERAIGEVIGVEMEFDGLEIRMPLLMILVPFLVLRNAKFSLSTRFRYSATESS
jgi:hypothetical protein